MKKNLFLIASAGFLLLSPVVYGMGIDVKDTAPVDTTTPQPVVTTTQVKSDDEIVNAVKKSISADSMLSKYIVTVSAKSGVVTLSGVVDNEKVKSDFGYRAKTVNGVVSVNNNIVVKAK